MREYTVQSPLLHDGEMYAIEQPVTMDEKQAALLLEQGVIIPAPATLRLDRDDKPVEEMTSAELKKALARLKIEIPRGVKKPGLVDLYNQAVGATPDKGNPS